MAKRSRGGRPRKAGPRDAKGRLIYRPDPTEPPLSIEQRAFSIWGREPRIAGINRQIEQAYLRVHLDPNALSTAAELELEKRGIIRDIAALAKDQRFAEPLGVLNLRGEINRAQYLAGTAFRSLQAVVGPRGGHGEAIEPDGDPWGSTWHQLMPQNTQSHFANLVASILPELSEITEEDRRRVRIVCDERLRNAIAYLLIEGKRPLAVLENIDGYGTQVYMSRADHQALTGALDRLIRLWKVEA